MSSIQKSVKSTQKTLGQILRDAREDKQFSIHDITQRLLLNKQIIIDIENDDYSKILAKVYAEGYLRAYAKLLHLSVDDILENFRSLDLYRETYSEVPSPGGDCSGNFFTKYCTILPKKLILLGGILGLVVLSLFIGIIVFSLKENSQSKESTVAYSSINDDVAQNLDDNRNYQPESILVTNDLSIEGQRYGKDRSSPSP